MLDLLLENFRAILIGGILAVVAVGQVNRLAGAVLSLVFWVFVAALGSVVIARGGSLGLAFFALPPWVFYALCGLMVTLYALMTWSAVAARRRRARLDEAAEPLD